MYEITEILKINILVLRFNISDNNKYEYINYFGDVNINKDIRPLCILEFDEASNHFRCLYYNLNSNADLDNYRDLDENDNILEEKKISKTSDNISIYDNNKSQMNIQNKKL